MEPWYIYIMPYILYWSRAVVVTIVEKLFTVRYFNSGSAQTIDYELTQVSNWY